MCRITFSDLTTEAQPPVQRTKRYFNHPQAPRTPPRRLQEEPPLPPLRSPSHTRQVTPASAFTQCSLQYYAWVREAPSAYCVHDVRRAARLCVCRQYLMRRVGACVCECAVGVAVGGVCAHLRKHVQVKMVPCRRVIALFHSSTTQPPPAPLCRPSPPLPGAMGRNGGTIQDRSGQHNHTQTMDTLGTPPPWPLTTPAPPFV